jgi:hypothetical protein
MTMEERSVILQDLPTSVRGFVFQGEDGEPVIVVNSRLTREANRKTYDHEQKHIRMNELTDPTYNEYEEGN